MFCFVCSSFILELALLTSGSSSSMGPAFLDGPCFFFIDGLCLPVALLRGPRARAVSFASAFTNDFLDDFLDDPRDGPQGNLYLDSSAKGRLH